MAVKRVQNNPAGSSRSQELRWTITRSRKIHTFPPCWFACPTGNGCGNVVYNIFSVNQNFRTSYNYNYNLNLEQKLNASVLLTLGYVGSAGHRLLILTDINQPSLGTRPQRKNGGPITRNFRTSESSTRSTATVLLTTTHFRPALRSRLGVADSQCAYTGPCP